MADPLSYLRDVVTSGRPADLDGDALVLDGLRVPRRTLTNYRNRTDGSYYALDAVWFLWQKKDLPRQQYVAEAYAAGMPFVSQLDRTDLLNYVAGETSSSSQIDPAFVGDETWLALRGTSLPRPTHVQGPGAGG